jgi:hypothetical protein
MKRLGLMRGLFLQVGAVTMVVVLGAVCLPVIWAQSALGDNQAVATIDDTDSIDELS